MKHLFYKHEKCDRPGQCQYCDGGLASCTVCEGAESSLPTDCPGMAMSDEQKDWVTAGMYDYRNGQWICLIPGQAKA